MDNTTRDFQKIQELLRTFALKLKYQRFHDHRPVQQPRFETDNYRQLNQTQENEQEELIAKLRIQIKENLALAYEAESKASFYHFAVSEKLLDLKERVGHIRFKRLLSEDLKMTVRYVYYFSTQGVIIS